MLAIVAHQDEAEVLFGGTVARVVDMGARVNYVLCTDGARSGRDVHASDEEVARTRAEEQNAAARVLGVENVVFLGYRNGSTEPTVELRRDLVRQIRRFRPSLILTTPPYRTFQPRFDLDHPEHIAIGEATLVAVYPEARSPRSYPELLLDEGLEPHTVSELWVTAFGDADRIIDVSGVLEKKLEAIRCHVSQHPEATIEHWAGWMTEGGERVGTRAAESYRKIPVAW